MTTKHPLKFIIYFLVLCSFINSCNIYKQIPDDKSVLVSNKIEILGQEKDLINDFFYKGDLYKIPIQKPNKKIFGIPVSQHIWAFYNQKKVTQFSQFMKTKVGKAPVIFDKSKLETSRIALENYYFNIGHLDNKISVDYKTQAKKTKVVYKVTPNTPYKIREVYYDTFTELQKEVYSEVFKSNIKRGDIFNINHFINEIDRITYVANDKGYFGFNKDYVKFKYDTFNNINEIDVYVKILEESDTTVFQKYKVNDIFVFINSTTEQANINNNDVHLINNIQFVQPSDQQYNETFISKFIYNAPDSLYSKGEVNQTIRRLSELNNFKLINSSVKLTDRKTNDLDLVYSLTPYLKRKLSFGQSFYNSTLGFIGAQPTLTYLNRNITRKADALDLSILGAVEFNAYLNQNKNASGLISRTDVTFKSNYSIEKFLVPFLFGKNKDYLYNRSNINAFYTFSKRLGFYDIHNIGFTGSFDWAKKKQTNFNYTPVSFNVILFPESAVSEEFKSTLEQNPFLKSSFNNSFIIGSSFSLGHLLVHGRKKQNALRMKLNLETAGNGVFLLDKLVNFSKDDNGINVNDINVSQFFKTQFETTHSAMVTKNNSFHSRIKLGMAFPYGNSKTLPYIKQFFIGGPYSIRAFQPRTIGPGNFNPGVYGVDTLQFPRDQTGNISLELNAEFRFHIISFLKGALFVDAGNIWNSSENFSQDELGVFKVDEFYKQLYIGSGFGIRGDFNYFIMRFDIGVPVRVPYLTKNDWVILDAKPFNSEWIRNNLIINFAVGYPF